MNARGSRYRTAAERTKIVLLYTPQKSLREIANEFNAQRDPARPPISLSGVSGIVKRFLEIKGTGNRKRQYSRAKLDERDNRNTMILTNFTTNPHDSTRAARQI